jgi:hypothetical protein
MQIQAVSREETSRTVIASSIRKSTSIGHKSQVRLGRNGGKNNTPISSHRVPYVSGSVKPINGFDVRKYFKGFYGNYSFIENEEMVLKAIHYLYPIVKPLFEDFAHAFNYSEDSTPGEFLSDIFELLTENLDYQWKLEYGDDEFYLIGQVDHHTDLMCGHSIEINWFENLPKELSDIAYKTIGCIIKECHLPLYHGISEAEWILESQLDDILHNGDDPNEYEPSGYEINLALDLYESGKPKEIYRRLLKIRNKPKSLFKLLDNYSCKNNDEAKIVAWLKQGLHLCYDVIEHHTIDCDINESDDWYLNIAEACSIYWSVTDTMFQACNESFESRANEVGIVNFGHHFNLEVSIEPPELSTWPIKLTNWLDGMWGIYTPYEV